MTIFEAGSDGLFSTTESKQTSIDLVVQPKAAIPAVIGASGTSMVNVRRVAHDVGGANMGVAMKSDKILATRIFVRSPHKNNGPEIYR